MITNLDEIKTFNKKDEYNLMYEGNNLEKLFYESKQAGYEPQVKFNAGIISELDFKFFFKQKGKPPKAITYKVKTQNLVSTSIDGYKTKGFNDEDIECIIFGYCQVFKKFIELIQLKDCWSMSFIRSMIGTIQDNFIHDNTTTNIDTRDYFEVGYYLGEF